MGTKAVEHPHLHWPPVGDKLRADLLPDDTKILHVSSVDGSVGATLGDVLKELKKMNMHLAIMTGACITDGDTD